MAQGKVAAHLFTLGSKVQVHSIYSADAVEEVGMHSLEVHIIIQEKSDQKVQTNPLPHPQFPRLRPVPSGHFLASAD